MRQGRSNELLSIIDGRPVLSEAVHPMSNLLELSAEEVLSAFRESQSRDFAEVVDQVQQPDSPLHRLFAEMRAGVPADNPFHELPLFRQGALRRLFFDLHEHVMSHPVWRHPFFVRVFDGRFDRTQATEFALQYFNQIKNTRQCVALAVGRFHGLMPMPFGPLNERISELTQIILAQLVADEYGVGSHELADYPAVDGILAARTHIRMYRQLFEGLGVPPGRQDVAMLPGIADNVLTQRLLAASPAFSPLEALSSVGLGMEWGVPEFFSLLLGGLIRFAWRADLALTPRHLEVFIAHVRFDVIHAVAVMLGTTLHMEREGDVDAVKGACNTLMAGRYGMMSELYRHVFGEPCASLADIGLEARYALRDRRIAEELIKARRNIDPSRVVGGEAYAEKQDVPFVFLC